MSRYLIQISALNVFCLIFLTDTREQTPTLLLLILLLWWNRHVWTSPQRKSHHRLEPSRKSMPDFFFFFLFKWKTPGLISSLAKATGDRIFQWQLGYFIAWLFAMQSNPTESPSLYDGLYWSEIPFHRSYKIYALMKKMHIVRAFSAEKWEFFWMNVFF